MVLGVLWDFNDSIVKISILEWLEDEMQVSKIKEYSKSFFVKVLVGIITLPFIFWGMGDIFSGGSQNVVAKIDSEKISTQEFINYVRMLNIEEKDREKIINNNILEKILSSYIGNKVLELELNDLRLIISDKSLKKPPY